VSINIDSYFRLFHLLPVKGPNLKIRARISFKRKRILPPFSHSRRNKSRKILENLNPLYSAMGIMVLVS
jgi:hypothetical protein